MNLRVGPWPAFTEAATYAELHPYETADRVHEERARRRGTGGLPDATGGAGGFCPGQKRSAQGQSAAAAVAGSGKSCHPCRRHRAVSGDAAAEAPGPGDEPGRLVEAAPRR